MTSLDEQEHDLSHHLAKSLLEHEAAMAHVRALESEITATREALLRIEQARRVTSSSELSAAGNRGEVDLVGLALQETSQLDQLTAVLQGVLHSDQTLPLQSTEARLRRDDAGSDSYDSGYDDDVTLVKNLP
jgi:hypothetical protein